MTAAPSPRPPHSAAAAREEVAERTATAHRQTLVVADIDAAAQRRTLRTVEPEHQLVAALLNLDSTDAADILAHVRTSDFADHRCAAVSVLIRHLINQQQRPTPQAVAALARGLGKRLSEFHLTPENVAEFAIELYTLGFPITAWASAALVVEDSYRRQFETAGTRMAQMAATCAPVRELESYTGRALKRWRKERERLADITARTRAQPRTEI
ncbi:hypothetical protein AB0L82_36025 [Nocardia sp. NPDC052001]|uniref:hypothetical protein n=1 Tax=Nocardia sp. NPDC052001 TaxID=3154853 RepID=UPI003424693E